MKFDWSEYFNLAEELGDVNNNEAQKRSSISRAYYAAFCTARNYLIDDLGCQAGRDENVHKYVAQKFQDNNNRKMREIGNDLSRLRQLRNKADYEDTIFNINQNTKFALKLAKNIINKFNEL